jgi:hypothetical protein
MPINRGRSRRRLNELVSSKIDIWIAGVAERSDFQVRRTIEVVAIQYGYNRSNHFERCLLRDDEAGAAM